MAICTEHGGNLQLNLLVEDMAEQISSRAGLPSSTDTGAQAPAFGFGTVHRVAVVLKPGKGVCPPLATSTAEAIA
ncbi:MAG: hypothetical protein ACK59A_16170 [Cyanobacteriota bacterium]